MTSPLWTKTYSTTSTFSKPKANLKGIDFRYHIGKMTLSENDLLIRIADHVAKLSDIVTKQSKTILELDNRIERLENRLKLFEKAVGKQRTVKKRKK